MKTTCPGCSKHCTIDHPRCKYGRQYFAKQLEKCSQCQHCPKKKKDASCSKWESYVQINGTAWTLLHISKEVKKALKKKKTTEEKLLHNLTVEEREYIVKLLTKLDLGE